MADSMSVLNIKKEVQETNSSANSIGCYSPSTTTTAGSTVPTASSTSSTRRRNSGASSSNGNGVKSSPSVSPERQMCSSTTTLSLNSNGSYTATDNDGNVSNNGSGSVGNSSQSAGSSGNSIRDELRRLCLVCGDVASGFHYGVASCEACKAFFKRTIQGNIEYTCPANNECEINKRRRKACQACRFQKCLLMGMLKEGVRLDRVRGGRQKYRRNPVSNSYQTMQLLYQSSITSLGDVKILDSLSNNEPDILSVQSSTSQTNQMTSANSSSSLLDEESGNASTPSTTSSLVNIKSENSNIISDTAEATPPSTPTSSTPTNTTANSSTCIFQLSSLTNNNSDAHDILCVLSDLYDKELVYVIGWAKQIPGFTDLPLNDQMKLLQVSWAEILTLQLIFRSLPFNGKLCFATDVWMDELLAKECGYTEFYYHCVQVAQRLERISPRREEYYLLKALILANCDILLDDQSSLRAFRDSILNSLNDVVYLLRHSSAVSHQQQLLLLLPSLRQADNILRRFWRNVNTEGTITLKKLFMEMLDTVSR
ncbi:estrogen-related receptor [Haematobia irritans]|uniref:estrogen-related receptor n=1 Tax=Haematobia irritans TaxID=7368 RepID=UPI003F50B003